MAKCDLEVVLENPGGTFLPGEKVAGMVIVNVNQSCTCNGLEITLGWRTHGRGNRRTTTVHREPLFTGEWAAGEEHIHPFELTVPEAVSPTYNGTLLNVEWEVRATADIPWAFDPEAAAPIVVALPPGGAHHPGPRFRDSAQTVSTGGANQVVLIAVALASVAMFGAMIPMFLLAEGGDGTEMIAVSCIIFGTMVPILGLVGFLAMRRSLAEKKLGEVLFEGPEGPVHAGEPVAVRIAFTPLKGAKGAITAVFKGEEVVVSGSGTNKSTHRHTLVSLEQELRPMGPMPAGQQVEAVAAFTLPDDIAPSFEAQDNALRWTIEVNVDIPAWPDWNRTHLLHVAP